MVKAILFDFWGTLVENGIFPSPVKQAKYILRLRMPFHEFVVRFEAAMMTKPHEDLNEAFASVYEEFDLAPNAYITEKLVGMWNKNELLGKPFLDAIEALEYLKSKKIKIALMVNTTESIKRVLEKHDMSKYFDVEVFSYDVGLLKTDPEMFAKTLKMLKMKAEDVIMIGDSIETDVYGARKAGIRSVLLDRANKRLFQPKITGLKDLQRLIESGELEALASTETKDDGREEPFNRRDYMQ